MSRASAAALSLAAVGCVILAACPETFDGSWSVRRREHLTNSLSPAEKVGVMGAGTTGRDETGGVQTRREMRAEVLFKGEELTKTYSSFADYALESSRSASSLPVPVVKLAGQESALPIPIITIIGVEKGGTTNLRGNLRTHPMISGMQREVHFFDMPPSEFPDVGDWEGDGLDQEMSAEAAGEILSKYAKACLNQGLSPKQHLTGLYTTGEIIVDSSPRYMLSPISPYRISMVRPGGKFVVVLRDPTSRYFSQLRMNMCKPGPSGDARLDATFHLPGGAKDYLARADAVYQPYGAHCRGENASATDLWECFKQLKVYNPLYRGLYADQLERWFRVFDRSQIMVVSSSEMFEDFTGAVARVAVFAGLPEHSFQYDPSHEHMNRCSARAHRHVPDYFADGGRYETMLDEADLLRDWYRPHNERLFKLLGRDLMWE